MQDTDKVVDIDTSGPGAEVELDPPKETLVEEQRDDKTPAEDKSHENERETKLEDGGSADDAIAKSDEPTDVQDKEKNTEQKKELEEYSEGVKRRIAKLTKKMREAERREEAATFYARGVLEEQETDIIENTLKLKDVKVKDIMTPRSVIFALKSDFTVGQVLEEHETLDFTRIPIFEGNFDVIKGMVNRYEIINRKAEDQFSTRMHEISQEVPFVNENDRIDKVLELFIKNRDHMALVKDDNDILTGLITLEDAIETILGQEIVDEHDNVVDMRKLAKAKMKQKEILK